MSAVGDINEGLLKAKVPGYGDIMKDERVLIRLKKALFKNLEPANEFTAARAFKTRVVKPVADFLDGVSQAKRFVEGEAKTWIERLDEFGKVVGEDYIKMIKNRLVLGRMFPDKVPIGDLGPVTNQFSRQMAKQAAGLQQAGGQLAGAGLDAVKGNIGRAAIRTTVAAKQSKDAVREQAFQIAIENPDALTARIAEGVFKGTEELQLLARSLLNLPGAVRRGTGRALGAAALPVGARAPAGIVGLLTTPGEQRQ